MKKIEKKLNLAINVYGVINKKEYRIYFISKQDRSMRRINLQLIEDEETGKQHYSWIKNLDRFMNNPSKHESRHYFCDMCISSNYGSEAELLEHRRLCEGINSVQVRVEMPTEKYKIIEFRGAARKMMVPYVIYADFECLNLKVDNVIPENNKSSTTDVQKHIASSYCYIVVRSDGVVSPPVEYRGPEAAKHFLNSITETEKEIRKILSDKKPMKMTEKDKIDYENAEECHICGEEFNISQKRNIIDKVRDHDHLTGKYRGPAHFDCNLKWRINPEKIKIPVFFHNLRGYDAHLIMQEVHNTDGKLSCLANNTERYISFSIGGLQFADSIQFLQASLASLTDSTMLSSGLEGFPISYAYGNHKKTYSNWESLFPLLTKKGVYPYDYMDSFERFNEEKLPEKESFDNILNRSSISNEDYQHAKTVYEAFKCKNMGEYCDLYCRTDVLLLADIFENFRRVSKTTYKLDPARYLTSPSLSWMHFCYTQG